MQEAILVGQGHQIVEMPRIHWEQNLAHVPLHSQSRLSFMTPDHHRVRYFAVRELPRYGAPLPAEFIAQQLHLSLARVNTILAELEQHLFFLVRNQAGAVQWASPVTADRTPHQLTFSSGERLHAA